MYLLFGQETSRSDLEIQQLLRHVEPMKMGPCIVSSVKKVETESLSWSIVLEFDIQSSKKLDSEEILRFVRKLSKHCGGGVYYFRGSDVLLEDFWSVHASSVSIRQSLLHGLPMSCSVSSGETIFDFYMDWVSQFAQKNFTGLIAPGDMVYGDENRLRFVLEAITLTLFFKGPWVFRAVQPGRRQAVMPRNLNNVAMSAN